MTAFIPFQDLVKSKNYVDNTEQVYSLAFSMTMLWLQLPKGFGKSTIISTLQELFKHGIKPYDGHESYFKGLKIENLWEDNKIYHVLVLDFANFEDEPYSSHDKFINAFRARLEEYRKREATFGGDDLILKADFASYLNQFFNSFDDDSLVILIDNSDHLLTNYAKSSKIFEEISSIFRTFILIINANADKIRFLLETGVTALKNTYDLVDEMLIADASDRANFEKIEKKQSILKIVISVIEYIARTIYTRFRLQAMQLGHNMRKKIPVGVSVFEDLILNNDYYVDKTNYFVDVVEPKDETDVKVLLITRPRRFGKSLFMSALASFLEPNYDNPNDLSLHQNLFSSLNIYQDKDFCDKYMGKIPVVTMSLKDTNTEEGYRALVFSIGELLKDVALKLDFLNNCNLTVSEKIFFEKLSNLDEDTFKESFLANSLEKLCKLIEKYYKVQPIVLIDEYDVPLAKCAGFKYYEKFRRWYSIFLGKALKDSKSVKKAIITGCLRVTKESIFTGFNNFSVNSLTSFELNSVCGFTADEVNSLLEYYHFKDKFDIFKNWYDGYRIGNKEIYCPWDVVNYIKDLKSNCNALPLSYWKNSGDPSSLKDIFSKNPNQYADDMERLLKGESIEVKIDEGLSYQQLSISNNKTSFWTLLFSTGYLTLDGIYDPNGTTLLKIPNECIAKCFEDFAQWCFDVDNQNYSNAVLDLVDSLLRGDKYEAEVQLQSLLLTNISYRDFGKNTDKESYYQAFLEGILAPFNQKAFYTFRPNIELGKGFADISIVGGKKSKRKLAAIIEIKHQSCKNDLIKEAKKAIEQNKNRK